MNQKKRKMITRKVMMNLGSVVRVMVSVGKVIVVVDGAGVVNLVDIVM